MSISSTIQPLSSQNFSSSWTRLVGDTSSRGASSSSVAESVPSSLMPPPPPRAPAPGGRVRQEAVEAEREWVGDARRGGPARTMLCGGCQQKVPREQGSTDLDGRGNGQPTHQPVAWPSSRTPTESTPRRALNHGGGGCGGALRDARWGRWEDGSGMEWNGGHGWLARGLRSLRTRCVGGVWVEMADGSGGSSFAKRQRSTARSPWPICSTNSRHGWRLARHGGPRRTRSPYYNHPRLFLDQGGGGHATLSSPPPCRDVKRMMTLMPRRPIFEEFGVGTRAPVLAWPGFGPYRACVHWFQSITVFVIPICRGNLVFSITN
nr:unnamed protein product [Digitaria exilis]